MSKNGVLKDQHKSINGTVNIDDIKPKDVEKDSGAKNEKQEMVGAIDIFRYSNAVEKLLMILGSLGAIIHGVAMPCVIIVFGSMLDSFLNVDDICKNCTNITTQPILDMFNNLTGKNWECDTMFSMKEEDRDLTRQFFESLKPFVGNESMPSEFNQDKLLGEMKDYALYYCIIGIGVLFVSSMQVGFWTLAAKRQVHRIRLLFFKACLRQNIGWFDTNPAGELSTRLADDTDKIETGIGDTIATCIQQAATFLTCIVIGFYYGWLLTLVILACSPALALAAALMNWVSKTSTVSEQAAYAEAGGSAEEVISAIRTVIAFGGQEKECQRYDKSLEKARKSGIKKGFAEGLAMGVVMGIVFLSYALGFWFGTRVVLGMYLPELHREFSIGRMLIVFFSILIASFSFGQAGPSMKAFAEARGAAFYIYNLIERVPEIDINSEAGDKPSHVDGKIEFRDVHFKYPSRPDVKILQGLNLEVSVGKTVALVGSSGCGKSTTVQLIQRFYDVISGSVLLDGKDIKSLNLRWLRSKIGVVSQEPILFATTIAENIRYGRDNVTDAEIEEAAKQANAHSFIDKLPDKYNTLVGPRGAQLSGGQKQRIAIARALVNSPKILLLDEATSALDTESESVVQEALDKASHGRTTIVIAHRLSTIQNADTIVAFKDGVACEKGTHAELMKLNGVYAALVNKQMKKSESKKDEDDSSDETEDELEKEMELVRNGSVRKSSHLERKQSRRKSILEEPKVERVFSVTSTRSEEKKATEAEEKDDLPKVSFLELLSWNAKEWYFMVFGCLFSIVVGGAQPAFAVVFSKVLSTFISCSKEKMIERSEFYSLLFVAIAAGMFIATSLSKLMFSFSGEKLIERLRSKVFRAYLRQEIKFFDDPKNSTGALTTRLATEVSAVKGATGSSLGMFSQSLANLGTGIVIAFVHSWVLTLAILAFAPFIAMAGFIQMKVVRGGGTKKKELFEDSGKVATEAIENIRTVQSLGKEGLFYENYANIIAAPFEKEKRMSQVLGISFGISTAIIFFAYAALFTLGAWLIVKEEGVNKPQQITFEQMMITFSAIVFGAMQAGQATSFGPSYGKGAEAARHIKQLLLSEPKIDAYSTEGQKPESYDAAVEFKNSVFHYPMRPTVKVLRDLSVSVSPGQTLALVGSSGCGKSTTVQLIERFYDMDSGSLTVGGIDIRQLNVSWLRLQLGIVSQEPILFDRSIAENIKYGANNREVSMDEVVEAAKKSNIHEFISSLPEGYETRVGDKGTQLSGGQKQRVAIARALVRNPKILLLDEATSALDSESESIVQQALDNASQGRTTVVIAHRLSTIQKADKIAVIRHGIVTELGTHDQLMQLQGFYHKLQSIQKFQH